MVLTSKKRILSRARTLEFLSELADTPAGESLTLYLPPRLPPADLEFFVKTVANQTDIAGEITKIYGHSKTGSVIFWSTEGKYLVLPPFPISEKYIVDTIAIEPLRSLLSRDYLIALVLVRLGSYAVGLCSGEKLISSKVGTGLVHGRHRQGGSSAHRFERHRDKQIEYFLTRVCRHAREHIEPHVRLLDYIVYGGARTTILLLQKRCPLLGRLDKPALPPLLDIPEPRQAVLEAAVGRAWSSTVIEWHED